MVDYFFDDIFRIITGSFNLLTKEVFLLYFRQNSCLFRANFGPLSQCTAVQGLWLVSFQACTAPELNSPTPGVLF